MALWWGGLQLETPLFFAAIRARLEGRSPQEPTLGQHFRVMKRYLRDSVAYLGERQACLMMRSRLGWFVKGLHGSSQFRKTITLVSTLD